MSRRVLYLDCAGGAAGDMLVCALAEASDGVGLIDELPAKLGFPDVVALVQAIRAVKDNYESYSVNARKVAEERYGIDQMTNRYIEVIEDLVN